MIYIYNAERAWIFLLQSLFNRTGRKTLEPVVTDETSKLVPTEDSKEQNSESSAEDIVTETEAPREDTQASSASPAHSAEDTSNTPISSSPKDLITQGAVFLSGLAATLKSPEATERLVNSLVETDAKTGQTSLKIPVPDKQTVRNLLDIVGKLFG